VRFEFKSLVYFLIFYPIFIQLVIRVMPEIQIKLKDASIIWKMFDGLDWGNSSMKQPGSSDNVVIKDDDVSFHDFQPYAKALNRLDRNLTSPYLWMTMMTPFLILWSLLEPLRQQRNPPIQSIHRHFKKLARQNLALK
jgi:hypothetical protein